jgi:signal transduction histidine kinase
MPEGGTLAIGTDIVIVDEARAQRQPESKPGTYACMTVSDNGCGMTAEIKEQIFEPFFTTKGAGKATGLGLTTVHGLVNQHSGWIEVVSEQDGGAQFLVFLPCAPMTLGTLTRKPFDR